MYLYPLQFSWQDGALLITCPLLKKEFAILIAFTGRQGGISDAPYDTFNLAFGVGDDPSSVAANRQKLCSMLGLDPLSLTSAEQVHGSSLVQVTLKDRGRGVRSLEDSLPAVDGLVTKIPKIPLVLFFADCVPLALVHPQSRSIAIVHAGWKGTLENISSKAVEALKDTSGAEAKEFLAFIGPAIGPCCYEVGPEIIRLFGKKFGSSGIFANKLDLAKINFEQLQKKGVPASSIEVTGACTSCQRRDFFSHRAFKGITGRQAGLVALL